MRGSVSVSVSVSESVSVSVSVSVCYSCVSLTSRWLCDAVPLQVVYSMPSRRIVASPLSAVRVSACGEMGEGECVWCDG